MRSQVRSFSCCTTSLRISMSAASARIPVSMRKGEKVDDQHFDVSELVTHL